MCFFNIKFMTQHLVLNLCGICVVLGLNIIFEIKQYVQDFKDAECYLNCESKHNFKLSEIFLNIENLKVAKNQL